MPVGSAAGQGGSGGRGGRGRLPPRPRGWWRTQRHTCVPLQVKAQSALLRGRGVSHTPARQGWFGDRSRLSSPQGSAGAGGLEAVYSMVLLENIDMLVLDAATSIQNSFYMEKVPADH